MEDLQGISFAYVVEENDINMCSGSPEVGRRQRDPLREAMLFPRKCKNRQKRDPSGHMEGKYQAAINRVGECNTRRGV